MVDPLLYATRILLTCYVGMGAMFATALFLQSLIIPKHIDAFIARQVREPRWWHLPLLVGIAIPCWPWVMRRLS